VAPTPGPYVADMRGGSEFYSNRVLKEFKGVNQVQVDWVGAFNGFLKDLQTYIKKNHTTGLAWNPKGGDASAQVGSQGQQLRLLEVLLLLPLDLLHHHSPLMMLLLVPRDQI